MAATSKTLAALKLTTTSWTLVFNSTAAKNYSLVLEVLNLTASTNTTFQLAIVESSWSSGAPNDYECLLPGGVSGIAINAGTKFIDRRRTLTGAQKLIAINASANACAVRVDGWES